MNNFCLSLILSLLAISCSTKKKTAGEVDAMPAADAAQSVYPLKINPAILDGVYLFESSEHYSPKRKKANSHILADIVYWEFKDKGSVFIRDGKVLKSTVTQDTLIVIGEEGGPEMFYTIKFLSYDSLILYSESDALDPIDSSNSKILNYLFLKRIVPEGTLSQNLDTVFLGRWFIEAAATTQKSADFTVSTPRDTLTFYDNDLASIGNSSVEYTFKYQVNHKNLTLFWHLTDSALSFNSQSFFDSDCTFFIKEIDSAYFEIVPTSSTPASHCAPLRGFRKNSYD